MAPPQKPIELEKIYLRGYHRRRGHAKLGEAVVKLGTRQCLGEKVSYHFVGGDVLELNKLVDDTVPDSMVLDCNVFGSWTNSSMFEE